MSLFYPVSEKEVTRAIVRSFLHQFDELVESEVIIVGGGPSGLMAGWELAKGGVKKVVIVERNNYLGGGFWVGGYFMNKLTLRKPAEQILDELAIPYEEASQGLYVADAPHLCAKVIAATADAGVKFLNLTYLEDIILREGRVAGVVINWSPIAYLPKEIAALDPVPLEAKMVIDATGHDAVVVKKLSQRNLLQLAGEGPLWIEKSEDAIVENTAEVYPGLIITGMAVASVYGFPRMGPTFGGMLLSGKQAAKIARQTLTETIK
jgi:thiamine thiazole synthase